MNFPINNDFKIKTSILVLNDFVFHGIRKFLNHTLFFKLIVVSCWPLFSGLTNWVQASWNLDANGSYLSDNFSSSANKEYGLSFYSTEIQMGLDKSGRLFGGLHVHNLAINDNSTSNTNLTSLDVGPSLTWYIGDDRYFYLAAAYNPYATATYTTGSTSSTWTGTSTYACFGVAPELGKNLYFGVKLNYVAEVYTSQETGSVTTSNNYTRNVFFPSIVFTYHNK